MTEVQAEYEQIRQSGSHRNRERLLQLSQPKEPKSEWYTSVGPHVMWGTQQMMWPIKKSALSADASDRLLTLATPKRNFFKHKIKPEFYYSCGRSSVIWDVEEKAKNYESTERLALLSRHKESHKEHTAARGMTLTKSLTFPHIPQFAYSCGRRSPIWEVSQGARTCLPRSKTDLLAQNKRTDNLCMPDKPVQTVIPPPALKVEPSGRLMSLSTPKNRPEGPFRHPQWGVSENAKNSSASARCTELARPKGVSDGYQLPREVEWVVPKAAKRAVSTGRIDELSKPVIRASMDHVQFNPDVFKVKPLALIGAIPPGVDRLAKQTR